MRDLCRAIELDGRVHEPLADSLERPQHAGDYPPPQCADCLALPGRCEVAVNHPASLGSSCPAESQQAAHRKALQALTPAHRHVQPAGRSSRGQS